MTGQIPFAHMTTSTQRMKIGGLRGKLVDLTYSGERMVVEIEGLATDADDRSRFDQILVAREFYSQDRQTFRLRRIDDLQEREYPITDPRHPEYEDPGRIVRPAAKR